MGHRGAVTTGSGRGRRRVAGAWDVRMDVDYTWWARMGEARERIAVTLLEAKFRSISQYFRRDNPSHLIARREIPTSPLARIPLVSHVYFRPRAQQVKPWQETAAGEDSSVLEEKAAAVAAATPWTASCNRQRHPVRICADAPGTTPPSWGSGCRRGRCTAELHEEAFVLHACKYAVVASSLGRPEAVGGAGWRREDL